MKPQIQPLAFLPSTSTGGEDMWRVKTEENQGEKTQEDESHPLISLGLGIGGSTSTSYCKTIIKPDGSEKDNSFYRRIAMVKEEDHNDHVDVDQAVERGGCREYSVVRFTEEQMEELKRQMLILKYMVWGLPVPFQLLLPIWRTFSSSSFPPHLYLYKTSSPPFWLALFRGGFDQKQMMDPEPGRCRRTDGKKWRCHQSVIPNEKYCEKHMHRGSKRSRKLVEAFPYSRTPTLNNLNQNINPSNDIRPKFPEKQDQSGPTRVVMRAPGLTNCIAKSDENDKRNSNPSNDARPKFPENLDQNVPIGVVMGAPGLTTCTANSNENKRNNNPSNDVRPKFPSNLDQNGPTEVVVRTPGLTTYAAKSNEDKLYNNPSNGIRPKFPENLDQNGTTGVVIVAPGLTTCTTKSNEDNRNSEAKCDIVANERIAVINQASGLDFSPKSVLQNDTGMRCLGVESCKDNPESESRCRRTDGKKWRCKKEVLPCQKYCELHVNRGKVRSKKQSLSSSSPGETQATYGTTFSAKFPKTEQAKMGLGLDTNLKISLPTRLADPCSIIKDRLAQNGGNSSSTEATESDDSTDALDIIVLSP